MGQEKKLGPEVEFVHQGSPSSSVPGMIFVSPGLFGPVTLYVLTFTFQRLNLEIHFHYAGKHIMLKARGAKKRRNSLSLIR